MRMRHWAAYCQLLVAYTSVTHDGSGVCSIPPSGASLHLYWETLAVHLAWSHSCRVPPSVRPSFRLYAWNNSRVAGRIFEKFYIGEFWEQISKHSNFHLDRTCPTNTLHEVLYVSLPVCVTERNGMNRICGGIQTHVLCPIHLLCKSYSSCEKHVERSKWIFESMNNQP
jgi:hypothetical protein